MDVAFFVSDVELTATALSVLKRPEYKADFELAGICLTFLAKLKNDLEAEYELKHQEEHEQPGGPRLWMPD